MPLFSTIGAQLKPIKEKSIVLEKDIQKLTEANLEAIFGLQFIKSEFTLGSFRLDTVAYDEEAKAFVIIEYKRDKSFSVIDQGAAYLATMLGSKAEFVLEYNEKTGSTLKKTDVDWSQSRVIFLARSFNTHQQAAIQFRDLPIELWEVTSFENSSVLYNQLQSSNEKVSVKTVAKSKAVQSVTNELKVYTVDDHLVTANDNIKELFASLREKLLSFGPEVKEQAKKIYIAFKSATNFTDVQIQKKAIRLTLNVKSGDLNDPQRRAIDYTKPVKGHWGNGDYEIVIKEEADLPYAMTLVEQAYAKNSAR